MSLSQKLRDISVCVDHLFFFDTIIADTAPRATIPAIRAGAAEPVDGFSSFSPLSGTVVSSVFVVSAGFSLVGAVVSSGFAVSAGFSLEGAVVSAGF